MLRLRSVFLLPLVALGLSSSASAVSVPDLGPSGTYYRPSGQPSSFTIGTGGTVEELEAFLSVSGATPAAALSTDPVPSGLSLGFSATLLGGGSDALLRYDFMNTGASAISSLTFLSFLDAEIDETVNTFFNEYATTAGVLAAGQGFEVDEPGYVSGDIYGNAFAASLDGTNAVPQGAPDDVSMALSFALGALAPGQIARFELLISEASHALGTFALAQHDIDPDSTTVITFSGTASIVPEPGTAMLFGLGISLLAARTRRSGS